MARIRHLTLVLGDQLDAQSTAFDGFDNQKDLVGWRRSGRRPPTSEIALASSTGRLLIPHFVAKNPKVQQMIASGDAATRGASSFRQLEHLVYSFALGRSWLRLPPRSKIVEQWKMPGFSLP